MSLSKLIFTFATEASPTNPKSTVLRVKSLQFVEDGPSFMFPPELQDIVEHEELMKTSVAKSVKKSTGQIRGKFCTVKISLTSDLYSLYVDEDGNPTFNEYLLDQYYVSSSSSISPSVSEEANSSENVSKSVEMSLSFIVKDVVLQKFGTKRLNALTWIDTFESECACIGILET